MSIWWHRQRNVFTCREDGKDHQVGKDARVAGHPVRDNGSLLHSQITARPGEIAEQLRHLLVGAELPG